MFRNRNGNPVRRNYYSEVWAKAVQQAGLPKGTRFHDLRHTYASMLIRAGESVTVVSNRLRHASPVETLETYSHMWPDSDERTVTVLNAAHDDFVTERVTTVSPVTDLRR
ncbi:MAG: traSA:integrase fusion protein [Marmoricola sp.]|nr:traSA:integrase fusion protein [Marmoricola sp.]